ncbi:HAD family hydrolase [Pasteurellaceae bacterium 22721_9_1]
MLQAIIFDMDGVIVDTEYVEFALQKDFIQAVKERPDEITKQEYLQVVGKALKDIAKIIKTISGSRLSQEELAERYNAFFHSIFDGMDYLTIFRQDIKQIIQFAKQHHIKLAVASSSPLPHIQNILTQCGIINDFDLIVTGDLFAQSKPHPEIYQYTMQQLGVLPEYSVAIEDSYFGMVAAKKAGMTCIGYEETRMEIDQSLADYMGKDMLEILAIIKQLTNKE